MKLWLAVGFTAVILLGSLAYELTKFALIYNLLLEVLK